MLERIKKLQLQNIISLLVFAFLLCWFSAISKVIPVPQYLSVENIFVGLILTTSFFDIWNRRDTFNLNYLFISYLIIALLIVVSALPSFYSYDQFYTLGNSNWRLMTKVLLILPIIPIYLCNHKKNLVILISICSLILASYIFYNFFIVKTFDVYTGRPMISIWGRGVNIACSIIAMSFPLACGWFILKFDDKRWYHTLFFAILNGALLLSIIIAQSRAAALSAAIGLTITLLLCLKGGQRITALFTMFIGFSALMLTSGSSLWQRLTDILDSSATNRVQSIILGWQTFLENGWTGLGMNRSYELYHAYVGSLMFEDGFVHLDSHSFISQVLAEIGLPGFLIYGIYLLAILWLISKNFHRTPQLSKLILLAFGILLINMAVLPAAFIDWYHIAFAVLVGLSTSSRDFTKEAHVHVEV